MTRRYVPLPERARGLAIPVIVTGVALSAMYAAGLWVPWSPWSIDVQGVVWGWNASPPRSPYDHLWTEGFTAYGGARVVVSVGGTIPTHFCSLCFVPPGCLTGATSATPGFTVTSDGLVLAHNSSWEIDAVLLTPLANFSGSLTIELQFGNC
ncbi:MAG TPA: hypothetical protein VLY85_02255 [Thermoplasmata archaeon]|nr:hypothetical protein [Thermoplasmata archaeon]